MQSVYGVARCNRLLSFLSLLPRDSVQSTRFCRIQYASIYIPMVIYPTPLMQCDGQCFTIKPWCIYSTQRNTKVQWHGMCNTGAEELKLPCNIQYRYCASVLCPLCSSRIACHEVSLPACCVHDVHMHLFA